MKSAVHRFSLSATLIFLFFFLEISGLCGAASNQSIKNFRKENYHASNQNWSVGTSPNGSIYFANHWGLLVFDGVSWELHKLPSETILRSVLVVSDSLIYTSGYRELGYWETDEFGSLNYHSLNNLAAKYFSNNEESWHISMLGDTVFFHSYTKIYRYHNNTITPLEAPGSINTQHRTGNKILIAVRDQGIFSIEKDKLEPYLLSDFFQNKIVRFILPYKDGQLMIGTNSDGIFVWDGKQFLQWNPEWTDYFRKNEVNRAIIDNFGNLVIGTIIDGVSIFDQDGHFLANYNTSNGLQNNTVLGIATDKFNNIWLSLDNGIDFLSSNTSPGFSLETIPGIGAVYDAAVFENKLYLGTNRGLFYRDLDKPGHNYELVPNTQGHIWDCQVMDNCLLIGHNDGIMMVKNGTSETISRHSGGFSIKEDPFRKGHFIESTYSTMANLKKSGDSYVEDGIVGGFSDLIRYIEFDHLGNIWASHMHRAIYKLQFNAMRDSIISSEYFGVNSVFGKDYFIHVFKVENRIVFTTESQLYTYDDLNDSIIPYSYLNGQLKEFASSRRIVPAPDHHYWFITKEKIGLFFIYNNDVRLIRSYPRSLFSSNELIDNYENILPLSAHKAIVCLENGIAHLDASVNDSISEISIFTPKLKEINLTDRHGKIEKNQLPGDFAGVKYKYQNIQLRYSFPHYTHNPIYFRSFLLGLDQDWSDRTVAPNFSFDRLPPGNYELLVKAIDQWGNESQVHRLKIEIEPPGYLSNYARAGYSLLFIILLLGFRSWGIKQTRKKERLRHEKREKELIQLRNEKLRNEVKHKSKELANSTMSIIKKNEFLLDLKRIVTKQKEELGSRFPDKYYFHVMRKIENNISSRDDWQLFETNFERAHEQFLNKIKEMHPDLTAKDLRLCAYLRMNLSSKEIAPLLGISVRGVENHRYRLRKKMNLDHDEKLIDMILSL